MLLSLIQKEIRLELKNKSALAGLILYVVSTIFLCYMAFKQSIDLKTYNTLYWIIILFTAVNSSSKSFLQEREGRLLYYYSVCPPTLFIISKIIFNGLLLSVLSILSLVLFVTLLGNPIQNLNLFVVGVLLGSFGISSTLSLISAIASKSGNNPTLVSILGFPIILPLLLTILTLSSNALVGMSFSQNLRLLLVLTGLNVVVISLSYLLFPYLWRD